MAEKNYKSEISRWLDKIVFFFGRHTNLMPGILLFFTLILRVIALISYKQSIYGDFLLWDERVYHSWALQILGDSFKTSMTVHDFAPLPAYIMALIYKIFSPNAIYVRGLNIILGTATCYFVYLIGKETINNLTGLAACLIAAIYKPLIFFNITLLKTSLSVFLFVAALYLFLAILNKASLIKILIFSLVLGIIVGLMLNVRPNYILFIPFMPLFILFCFRKEKKSLKAFGAVCIIFTVGLAVAVSPFALRNYKISGSLVPTAAGGFNFYLANNLHNPYPYYRPVPFATSVPSEQAVQFVIEASRRAGKKLSLSEASTYWTAEVLRSARKHPLDFSWKILQKTLAFFNAFEASDNQYIGFLSRFVPFFRLPFLSLWFLFPFGMAGLFTNGFKAKKLTAMSLIFILYSSTLIVFFTNIRLRLPVIFILIPFTVIGWSHMISQVKSRSVSKIVIYFAVVLCFVGIEFLPLKGTNDMTAYYNTHAINLDSKGLTEEAVKYWEKSSQADKSYSDFANLSLAGKYFQAEEMDKVRFYLTKISDHSFAAAAKYKFIGDMMLLRQRTNEAVKAYEKSLDINPGQIRVRSNLAKLYEKTDKGKAMREYKKLDYIKSFYREAGLL